MGVCTIKKQEQVRINERIRVKEVRLIGPEGEQLGIVSAPEALEKAQGYSLDLVEVASNATPPVCRIMDYSKFKYEQEKKQREARKKQRVFHKKEIKMKPNIEDHDYMTKIRNAEKFLLKGDKVKFTMTFRGREMAHLDRGRTILNRVATELATIAEPEGSPSQEGRNMVMIMIPKTK